METGEYWKRVGERVVESGSELGRKGSIRVSSYRNILDFCAGRHTAKDLAFEFLFG